MGVTRTFVVTRCYNVRRYERWEVNTDLDLTTMEREMETRDFDDFVCANGEELSSDYDTVDDDQLDLLIEEVIEPEEPESLAVPMPPTTVDQAEAWVRWAETEIGMGWHPDNSGDGMVTFSPLGAEATCQCGEKFIVTDAEDFVHLLNEKGDECGLKGVVTDVWGQQTPLFPDPDVCARYDAGLEAAHTLLPDIYATSMRIFAELHPDVFGAAT